MADTQLKQKTKSNVLKLRVQNICCGKEADLIKANLADVQGVESVTVNVVGRRAFIKHKEDLISANDIIERLNILHLGISLVESGTGVKDTKQYDKKRRLLYLKLFSVFLMGILFIAVVVAKVKNYSWIRWVSIPILLIGGVPMLVKSISDFKRKVFININFLMLLAVGGAMGLREWMDACIILFIFAIAELLENKVKYKVEKDIAALMMVAPEVAVLADTNKTVPVEEVPTGTLIIVTAGERIPLDGEVDKGRAAVDESSITGEATPISKKQGSAVYSGTIVQSGYLKIKTTCDYQSSTVYKVSQLVAEAQSKSSQTEEMVNKFAKYYTPSVLFVAFLLFIVPYIMYKTHNMSYDAFHQWGIRSLTMLLVACPCSIIMAAPIPSVCSITRAAKFGVLIKGGTYLERLSKLNVIAFDKTGTLTEGRFQVLKEHVVEHVVEDELRNEAIKLAASLETKSSHPLAACIVNHYCGCVTDMIDEHGVAVGLPEVSSFENHDGMGLSGNTDEHHICVGNAALMKHFDIAVDDDIHEISKSWSNFGCTVIMVGIDGKVQLLLGLADKVRATSRKAVQALNHLGMSCVMLTGDGAGSADAIKQQVGLSECHASMKPNEKFEWLTNKQNAGGKGEKNCVAMIGDGVNDSPTLAAADVGIAIGSSGAAIAVESAGISLMTDDLMKIVDLISIGKYCQRVIWQNIIGGVFIKLSFVIAALIIRNLLWLAVLSDVLGLLFVMINGLRPLYWSERTTHLISDDNISLSHVNINLSLENDVDEERRSLSRSSDHKNYASIA